MRYSRHRALFLAFGVCFGVRLTAGLAGAATFHVAPQGSNTPPYDSYAKAAHEIADALLTASGYGDTVLVHTGVYSIDTTICIPQGLVWAGVGRDSVTINWSYREYKPGILARLLGDNEVFGLDFNYPMGSTFNPVVVGLWAYAADSVVVRNCRLRHLQLSAGGGATRLDAHDNEFYFGATWGINWQGTYAWIHDNRFFSRNEGSGIYCHMAHSAVIEHNLFDGDVTRQECTGIDIYHCTSITVRNNIILHCSQPVSWHHASGNIENNTMVGAAWIWAGMSVFLRSYESVVIRNNVMQDFVRPLEFGPECSICPATGPVTYVHNVLWPPRDSTHAFWKYASPDSVTLVDSANIFAYPMFTYDSTYRLQFGSPMIDAGDPAVLDADSSRSDVGWTGGPGGYTYAYPDLPPLAPESLRVTGDSTVATLTWKRRPEGDLGGYRLYRGLTHDFWFPGSEPRAVLGREQTQYDDTLPSGIDSTFYVLTALDAGGYESAPSAEVRYLKAGPPVNHRPVISAVADQGIAEGDTLALPLSASDEDDDPLLWTAEALPSNAEFTDHGDGTATLTFRPDSTQSGTYVVQFIVSDTSLADTEVVSITVRDVHTPPLPRTPRIVRAYPNPMNNTAVFEVAIPAAAASCANVEIRIYDVLARHVATAFQGSLTPGYHSINWLGSSGGISLASGVYFAQLRLDEQCSSRTVKLVIIK